MPTLTIASETQMLLERASGVLGLSPQTFLEQLIQKEANSILAESTHPLFGRYADNGKITGDIVEPVLGVDGWYNADKWQDL